MKRFILPLAILVVLGACTPRDRYIQIQGYAQGGTYTVKVNVKGVNVAPEEIRDSIQSILTCIDTTLSGYNQASLLSRLNRGEKIVSTPMLREMYALAYGWYERSEGALDFAAGPLYDAWGFGFKQGQFPTDEEVKAILGRCGMKFLKPEMPEGYVSMEDLANAPGKVETSLNFNAIAQGYTSDKVASYLYSVGAKDMLVDIGEIWCDGVNPAGQSWSVGIDRPFDRPTDGTDTAGEELSGIWSSEGRPLGIVTSGNYRKYYVKDGRKFAHTIDPRSGYPVEHQLLSATVVSAVSSADADALATCCMVLGPEKARELILSLDGVEGFLVSASGEGMQEWASPGFTLREN